MTPAEQIKERLPIDRFVSAYVKLEKAGSNWKGRCPFHNEKTPSFFVNPDRGSFHCFGCGKGGDLFTFVQEIEHIEFKEALHMLAERAGVTITAVDIRERGERARAREVLVRAMSEYEKFLSDYPNVREYLEGRGVNAASMSLHRIGFIPEGWANLASRVNRDFSPDLLEKSGLFIKGERGLYDRFRGRIMFPIFDHNGEIVGFTGRLLKNDPESREGKYVNSPETLLYNKSKILYGYDKAKTAIREKNECVLVEGQLDVILSQQIGISNTVGVSGTALTPDHMRLISRLAEKIVIVLDGDEAGFKASARAVMLALAADLDVYVVGLASGKDPADMARENPEALKDFIAKAERFIPFVLKKLSSDKSSSRDLQKQIRDLVYPYIREIGNPIERDLALQKVSETLGVSAEATREDWKKHGGEVKEVTRRGEEKEVVAAVTSSSEKIVERIRGLYLFAKAMPEFTPQLPHIEAELKRILGMDLDKTPDTRLEFEASVYYNGADLVKTSNELLHFLELAWVKEELSQTLTAIKEAESRGSDTLPELLIKSRELSKRLHELH